MLSVVALVIYFANNSISFNALFLNTFRACGISSRFMSDMEGDSGSAELGIKHPPASMLY